MESIIKDIRYGFRSLLNRPGFTAVALIALALGIGANTAIFSLVNAVVLQPLPFPDPDRLVWVWGNISNGGNRASVAPLDYLDFRSQNKTFEQIAASGVPLTFDDLDMKIRRAHFLRPIGRLKEGVTLVQAQADTDLIAAALEEQFPDSNTGWNLRLVSLREQLVGGSRTTVFILFGAVGFVLLIACANVANLLLVRAAARQKEIAMRTALGASRWRIVRQMITESLLLSILGGVLGAVLAVWGVQLLVSLSEGSLPRTADVRIDTTVLAFTLLISLLTGLLFGLAPAFRTTLLALFAALAMILAATGIYGVMSYSVTQRTHEIGVRMALGARRVDVMKLVVRHGMILALVGVVLGLGGAYALTRVMSSLLFGVTEKDPITFGVVAALLIAVSFIACFVPARRATKVDLLEAPRYE